MKKVIIVVFTIFAVLLAIIYFSLPSPLKVSNRIGFTTSMNGAYQTLSNQEIWDRWSVGTFTIKQRLVNTIDLNINYDHKSLPLRLILIPMRKDSVSILWEITFPNTTNPVRRIRHFTKSFSLINKVEFALSNFQLFVKESENVYGYDIGESSTKDTFLVVTKFTTTSYPSSTEIYSHVNRLKSYAASVGAEQAGDPMLNASTIDSVKYNCMVALPINKIVKGRGPISFVRMVPGRFLTVEVKGGPHTIKRAYRTMDKYYDDFGRQRMAIPFEYLVTDRLKQPDTSKWVTRIYGPVY